MGDFYIDRVNSLDAQIRKAQAAGNNVQAAAFCREAARAVEAIAVRTVGQIRDAWKKRSAEYLAAEPHVEHVEYAPGNVHDQQCPENAYDVGAPQHAVQLVDEQGDKENV